MSPRNLARAFRREVGTTPASLVEALRLEAARSLLETTDLTIAALAGKIGLRHAATLHRAFQRRLGTTPGSLPPTLQQEGIVNIAIALYPGFTSLDFVGPYQVFANLPGAEVVLCAARRGPIDDDNGLLHLRVDTAFDEVPAPDVLLVPGGLGTRRAISDGHPIVEWVRAAHEHTTWTTSVCTGALVLGAAGLLRGVDATTHWCSYDALAAFGASPTERRVVTFGKVVTAAGVSSGIDLALLLVARLSSPEMAQAIQLGIEYDPQPPFDAGSPSKAPAPIRELVAAYMANAEMTFATSSTEPGLDASSSETTERLTPASASNR